MYVLSFTLFYSDVLIYFTVYLLIRLLTFIQWLFTSIAFLIAIYADNYLILFV